MKNVLYYALVSSMLTFIACGGETKTEAAASDTTAVTDTEMAEDTAFAPVDTVAVVIDSAMNTPVDSAK